MSGLELLCIIQCANDLFIVDVNIIVSLEGVIDDLKLIYKSSSMVDFLSTPDEDKLVRKTRGTYVRVDCSTNQLKNLDGFPSKASIRMKSIKARWTG